MKPRKKKEYPDDDGRVIVPMNVDGMPWYNRFNKHVRSDAEREQPKAEPMSRGETFKLVGQLYLAMLPIVLLFVGVFALVIWLLTVVWD